MAGENKTALVVSAHSADYVWRAGGAIALYASRGWRVKVVCLSYGERGESARLWKEGGMTLERVKAERREEALAAADVLGAEVEFFDCGDYPMNFTREHLDKLVDIYRSLRPSFVLTHPLEDPYNFDHPLASHVAQEARIVAQAHGHKPEVPVIGAPPVFFFEPHQPEQCNWKPQLLLDITPVWEKKRKAFELMAAQEYMWDYYTRVGINRGVQAERNSDKKGIKYAEAYQRLFPLVTGDLT
ncbi:MAG: PIG-L family deacetylase [Deltaproteobacteria bacterium]|nr:PIG-L family deacetylase [Deltaproteobacteria bacterium]